MSCLLFSTPARAEPTVHTGGFMQRRLLEVSGSARVVPGDFPAYQFQGGVLAGQGAWRTFLGAGTTLFPDLGRYGAGPVVGGRFTLSSRVSGAVDLGADYFPIAGAQRERFAFMVHVAVMFDLPW
ncbi:hypothetical protein [Pyxidicoccus fallax]|uniref:Uncharacterized protein n=1 Tax=Pyxidicoccus fallax TaxID=394095 RepID=A0A848LP45_9BACT|nr:hypothetical protein [Pyxidicoccus fallax]NMO19647.1 hypothetical protein [Pyxidicoccus fallax]